MLKKKCKYCEVCDRIYKNNNWSAHLKTKIHLENVEKKNASGTGNAPTFLDYKSSVILLYYKY